MDKTTAMANVKQSGTLSECPPEGGWFDWNGSKFVRDNEIKVSGKLCITFAA